MNSTGWGAGHVGGSVVSLWTVGIVSAVTAVILSGTLMAQHWRHYTRPAHQRYILRCVAVVPLYAVYSMAAMLWVSGSVYLALLRDCYEALALYSFFRLCVELCGGEDSLLSSLEGEPPFLLPFPLCRLRPCRLNHRSLLLLKRLILQYVLVRPLTSLVALITQALDLYHEGSWSFNYAFVYVTIVANISFTLSLYALVAFYVAVKKPLQNWKPLLKFACIKLVVFFVFWQSILFAILVGSGAIPPMWIYSPEEVATLLMNFIVCVEMSFIAVLHIFAYPVDVYRIRTQSNAPLVGHSTKQKTVMQAMAHSLTQKDTVVETIEAFGNSDHSTQSSSQVPSDFDESLDIEALPDDDSSAHKKRSRR